MVSLCVRGLVSSPVYSESQCKRTRSAILGMVSFRKWKPVKCELQTDFNRACNDSISQRASKMS